MKGPKTLATVVAGFVVAATGLAFADTALTTQNISASDEPTTTLEPTTTTTESPTTTTTEAEHQPTRSTVGCPDGFTGNHGQFVSSVAQTHPEDHSKVTEAAHSDCGKVEHDATEHATEHETDDTETEHESENHGPSANAGTSGGDHSGSDSSGSGHGGSGHGGSDDK